MARYGATALCTSSPDSFSMDTYQSEGEYHKMHNSEKGNMDHEDSSSDGGWDVIRQTSDFALLTDKVCLLKSILQTLAYAGRAIVGRKNTNTMEFTREGIHMCSRDSTIIHVVDLNPSKMGMYQPPRRDIACTFQYSKVVNFIKSNRNSPMCLFKPKDSNTLKIILYENNVSASNITLSLDLEDSVQYVDDSQWDSLPHINIKVPSFSEQMRYARGSSLSTITGYAKHMCVYSEHKVNNVQTTKLYGIEPSRVSISNSHISKLWEDMVESHMSKMSEESLDSIPDVDVVVLNHPISKCRVTSNLAGLLCRINRLSKADKQPLAFYFHHEQPMKIELEMKDGGVLVGTYKIYILGTTLTSEMTGSTEVGGDGYQDEST